MKIFFDFDDFFLDTEGAMIRDYFSLLKQLTGASDNEMNKTFATFSGGSFVRGETYSPERHIGLLQVNLDFDSVKVIDVARTFFFDIRKYCFEGTEDFLNTLPKNDLYLLTFGEEHFQNLKVDGSGLRKFFHQVIVTQGNKFEEIEQAAEKDNFLTNETIIFCDNRCGHFVGAKERGIITIHLKRLTDKYSNESCGECQFVVSGFHELTEIIQSFS